jgi:hypothetical protein
MSELRLYERFSFMHHGLLSGELWVPPARRDDPCENALDHPQIDFAGKYRAQLNAREAGQLKPNLTRFEKRTSQPIGNNLNKLTSIAPAAKPTSQ